MSMSRSLHRAVVTGGGGFLGSHLCEHLLTLADEVLCVDNFLTGSPDNIDHLLARPGFSLVRGDVSDVLHVSDRVDLVLHFASPASPVDYLRMPIETMRGGSLGTFNTLDLAHRKGARYVLASTSEVYGDPLEHPQRESYWGNVNPVGPRGVYDEAKRFSEALATAYRTSRATDTGIVRIFNTYGPRMRPDDGRAIPTFIRQALDGAPMTVAGDGSQTRSICYVEDTVRGILDFALGVHDGPVNIGTPNETSMLDLAVKIRDLAGSDSPIEFVDLPVDDPRVRRPDTSFAEQILSWKPQVDPDEGLRRTIAWFQERRRWLHEAHSPEARGQRIS